MSTTHDDTHDDALAARFEARLAALEQSYARKLGALEREVTTLRAQQLSSTTAPTPSAPSAQSASGGTR